MDKEFVDSSYSGSQDGASKSGPSKQILPVDENENKHEAADPNTIENANVGLSNDLRRSTTRTTIRPWLNLNLTSSAPMTITYGDTRIVYHAIPEDEFETVVVLAGHMSSSTTYMGTDEYHCSPIRSTCLTQPSNINTGVPLANPIIESSAVPEDPNIHNLGK